jgi:hypothetical protein
MRKPAERRGLIASFLVVYLAIVLLLAGLVTAGFHLYRTQVSHAGIALGSRLASRGSRRRDRPVTGHSLSATG